VAYESFFFLNGLQRAPDAPVAAPFLDDDRWPSRVIFGSTSQVRIDIFFGGLAGRAFYERPRVRHLVVPAFLFAVVQTFPPLFAPCEKLLPHAQVCCTSFFVFLLDSM